MAKLITWVAKRVILARIVDTIELADVDDALYGVQTGYALPPNPERVCVYLGRARSTRAQSSAEHAVLFREDVLVDVRIRVNLPGGDVQAAEEAVEAIASRIATIVSAEPRMADAVAVTAVDQDPTIVSPDPDSSVTVNAVVVVSLSMQLGGA